MSDAGRIDAIAAAEAGLAWLAAVQNSMLATLTRQPGTDPSSLGTVPVSAGSSLDKEWESLEVSCVLGISAHGALDRVALARELHDGRLADTGAAMRQGLISGWRAKVLSEELEGCDDTAAGKVQADVLSRGANLTFGLFRRAIRTAITTHAAPVEAVQRERAVQARKVQLGQPDRYGMTGLFALLPAEGAAALYATLDAAARGVPADDARTLDQRRADALVQLGLATGPGGATSGLKPAVNVSVALSTLLGFDEQACELNGEPIPATLARHLAADESGTWRRLLTDERGILLDYGRKVYRPPASLARFVIARDRQCVFPTCTRNAETCELDHQVEWANRGGTNADNIAAVSPRHHHAKHDGGWQKKRLPDGATEWTSPTGHHYVKPPATYPIDRTALPDDDPPPF
jgi:hypothetical protein